ncbi:MAG: undecaprenyl-diphosphate phosphatase [Candidatus Liptonbacteria bacterium]|nr:undecaprenyl-diphosphate phosphatase [Candidatus Liptonbacteria bacterium]
MTFIHSIILGLVEGITEFLPISSTGHLILTSKLLNLSSTEFLKTFEIFIQLGAILSVIVLYFKTLTKNFEIIKRLFVAFLPTAVIGLALYKVVKKYFLDNTTIVLVSLLLGGIFLIIFEKFHQEKTDATENLENISYKQSFIIGLFQSIAVVPGVSRAAATIVGGLFLGLKRQTIVEFSFLLAVPTMLAATGLDLIKNASSFSSDQFSLLAVGFITSFVVALFAIKFLLKFISNHTFTSFGIYRVIVAIILWLIVF